MLRSGRCVLVGQPGILLLVQSSSASVLNVQAKPAQKDKASACNPSVP